MTFEPCMVPAVCMCLLAFFWLLWPSKSELLAGALFMYFLGAVLHWGLGL